jgi:hypothetical protein
MAFTIIDQGSFTSAGVGVSINVPSSADYFRVQNITQMSTPVSGTGFEFEWYNGITPLAGAQQWLYQATLAVTTNAMTAGGFSYYTTYPNIEPAVTGTAITNATPAVVSMTNTYSNGDRVQLYGTTGMQQIAGMNFTISSVSGAGFTLLGLPAAAFAAPATAVVARRISPFYAVEPEFLFITNISQALQAVVTVSIAHNYVVGQLVTFSIPSGMGMVQLSGQTGVVTAVSTYTLTVNINTSTYTAFSFPTSALSPKSPMFATLAPAGQKTQYNPNTNIQTGYNFNYVPFHNGQFTPFMYLGAGANGPAGQTSDIVVWQAYKMES